MKRTELEQYASCISDCIEFTDNEGCRHHYWGMLLFGEDGVLIADSLFVYGHTLRSIEIEFLTEENIVSLPLIPYEQIFSFDTSNSFHSIVESNKNILNKLKSYVSVDSKKCLVDKSKYPNVCPKCGAPAYLGLMKIDCIRCGEF